MVYKPKKFVDIETSQRPKKYVCYNDHLIEKKLEFVQLQKEKFLEEHALKMEIINATLKIKMKKLINLEIGN